MEQIRLGFLCDLSMEQVQLYANTNFNWCQMDMIRVGFTSGLSMEQVQLYSNSKFDYNQMKQIRTGFESGITIEQMKQILNIVEKNPSVSEKLDSMDHTPCTTTDNQNRDETVK